MGTGRRGEDGALVQILVEPELKLVSVPVTTHVRITVAPTVLEAVATPRPVMYPVLVSDRTVINCLLQNQFDPPPPPFKPWNYESQIVQQDYLRRLDGQQIYRTLLLKEINIV